MQPRITNKYLADILKISIVTGAQFHASAVMPVSLTQILPGEEHPDRAWL